MSSLLEEHITGREQYKKDLGASIEIKLRKIKDILNDYKKSTGIPFKIQKTDWDKGIEKDSIKVKKPHHCKFHFSGLVNCGLSGVLFLHNNELRICEHYGFYDRKEPCLNKDLEFTGACLKTLNKKMKYIDDCEEEMSDYDLEAAKDYPNHYELFSTLEAADKVLNKFLPYIRDINREIESKRKYVKSSLEEWKVL